MNASGVTDGLFRVMLVSSQHNLVSCGTELDRLFLYSKQVRGKGGNVGIILGNQLVITVFDLNRFPDTRSNWVFSVLFLSSLESLVEYPPSKR